MAGSRFTSMTGVIEQVLWAEKMLLEDGFSQAPPDTKPEQLSSKQYLKREEPNGFDLLSGLRKGILLFWRD